MSGFWKIALLLLATACLISVAVPIPALADDWAMFRGDPDHCGSSTSGAPNTCNVAWTYTTGGAIYASSAVVGGNIYIGTSDGRVFCLDAITGTWQWEIGTWGPIYSSPAVVDGRVYLGTAQTVLCLDAMTGTKLWDFATGGVVFSSPAVVNGRVYIASQDGNMYCLDAVFGVEIWRFTTEWPYRIYSSPAIVDGKVYIGSDDHKVYCLDAVTGAKQWSFLTGGEVYGSPAVVGGKVYVGSSDTRIYCLDAATGVQQWRFKTGNYVMYSSPAVADGRVYAGSYDCKFYCLDASDGTKIWDYTTGNHIMWSSPAIADGKVYVGSYDSKLYCLDASGGTKLWDYTTGKSVIWSLPAIRDGWLYLTSDAGKVYAFADENVPPNCSYVYLPTSVVAAETVQFTDTSMDPDGIVTGWSWDFGDGGTSIQANPTHVYSQGGNYESQLTVADSAGLIATYSKTVSVADNAIEITLVGPAWNMISIPAQTTNPDPWEVFDELRPLLNSADQLSGNLHRYDSEAMGYVTYQRFEPGVFGQIISGDGYWLWINCPTKISITLSTRETMAQGPVSVYFPIAGWHMFGSPSLQDVPIESCIVKHNNEPSRSFAEAANEWLQDPICWYDPNSQGYLNYGLSNGSDDKFLHAFQAYWIYTFVDDVTLEVY